MYPQTIQCFVQNRDREEFFTRGIVFPFTPYPGLFVGAHRISRVSVCQGNLDGGGEVHVELEPVDDDHASMLRRQGWRLA